MNDENAKPKTAADRRKAKLAAELRANLLKRKAQVRGRRDAPASMLAEEGDTQDEKPD